MLDNQTKKRIDDCRDILVGKLPDPKAQIEQITIALIYKFMDDMDKEAVELGGEARFFADYTVPDKDFPDDRSKDTLVPFSNYAWDNLLNPMVTAAVMLQLYSAAIEGMEKNPNIPQLFRDIFKNAYLPYRDPETLKLFLKTIGEFEYSHSEKLGDAFEYLLSVMGSQGDAGQFRTPRHIIDFLVAIVNPQKTDTILDPACGTAGFLISAYKHILDKNTQKGQKDAQAGNLLTPDDRRKLILNFSGYDISPDMVRLSLVNLYLHGFSNPNIVEYDTLSSEERWNENYDVILANPPFMSPKGGIRPHKKFSISSNRSEVLFVDYIAEHLNPGGKAGIIVPEGVIFQSGKAYKELRKMLVDNYLYAVVSLPPGVFNPYSGVKTSILLLDKAIAKQREEMLFIKIENDGYNLGAQRTPIKGSQLEEATAIAHHYLAEGDIPESEIAHLVPKAEIAKNGEYNLSGERYAATTFIQNSDFKYFELQDLTIIQKGTSITKKSAITGDVPVIAGGQQPAYYHNEHNRSGKVITVSASGAYAGFINYFDQPIFASDCTTIQSDESKINTTFLFHLLKYKQEDFYKLQKGGAQPHVYGKDFGLFQIPLPPLSVQEEIVAEIEAYQKIIDGAKAVVDNYKPKIDIDPDWEMVELGEVCEVNPKKSELKNIDENILVSFLPMADLNENQIDFEPKQSKPLKEVIKGYTYFKDDDVLLAKVTPCFENGKAGVAKGLLNGIGFGSSEYYVIRPNEKILSTWIYLNVITNNFRERGKLNMTGTGGLQRVPQDFVKSNLIPVPPIETQRQIVAEIEKEQALVAANKELIAIFEQKIKDRIAKVWGE